MKCDLGLIFFLLFFRVVLTRLRSTSYEHWKKPSKDLESEILMLHQAAITWYEKGEILQDTERTLIIHLVAKKTPRVFLLSYNGAE